MVILSSPSGAGKTTLVNFYLKKIILKFQYLIQQDNQDQMKKKIKIIFLLNDEEFKRLIKNDEFLEYAKVFNNYYGTTRTPVIDKFR